MDQDNQKARSSSNTAPDTALRDALLAVAFASARHSTQACSSAATANLKKSMPPNHSIIEHRTGSHPDQFSLTRRTNIAGSHKSGVPPQKYDEQRMSDEDIIKDEMAELDRYHTGAKRVFLRAAEKLEKSGYYDDLSVISSRLSKIWPDYARQIRDALPPKYKSSAKVREPNHPETKIQEIVFRLAELNLTHGKMNMDLFEKMQADPEIERLVEIAFCGGSSANPTPDETRAMQDKLNQMLEQVIQQEAATDLIKSKEDLRQKLSDFQKIMLSMQTFMTSISDAADNIDMSAKWAKAIRDDPGLAAIIEQFRKCPACNWDMKDWFDMAAALGKKGIAAPRPDARERNPEFLCRNCEATETELIKKLEPMVLLKLKGETINPRPI